MVFAYDGADQNICFKWPRQSCEGGKFFVIFDYWHSREERKEAIRFDKEFKSIFKEIVLDWNQKSEIQFDVHWGTVGPSEKPSNEYLIYFQVRELEDFTSQMGLVVSATLYGYDNNKWNASGPIVIKEDLLEKNGIGRFIECYIIQKFYSKQYGDYLRKNDIKMYDYCRGFFVREETK